MIVTGVLSGICDGLFGIGGPLMVVFYLALACGLGALVRYFFSRYNQGSVLPLGTLIANLLGLFFDWIYAITMWSQKKSILFLQLVFVVV